VSEETRIQAMDSDCNENQKCEVGLQNMRASQILEE
jgi:hypothetical protein